MPAAPAFIGDGEMAERMRAMDWSSTGLGASETWPLSLKTAVRIMLTSRYAMWMAWGPELIFFCNDAYLPTVGIKRDWVLGARSDKVWAEIWPDIGPRIERVLATGNATWDEALLLFLERLGFAEETYHTFSYSPLADDHGTISGMLCVVTEETERVIGERRLRVLRDLGARMGQARTEAEVWKAVEACLRDDSRDLPMTLGYLFRDGEPAALVSVTGVSPAHPIAPAAIELRDTRLWPLGEIARGAPFAQVDDLVLRANDVVGPWGRPPDKALAVPIAAHGQVRPLGAFLVGLNPYRPLDASYHGFIQLFVGQVAAGLANAYAYEAERRRAEGLAEVDRAKTTFFSNVSHEFRTPLTLMLGVLEEILAKPGAEVEPGIRRLVDTVHRNGLRLLQLVNALLDFSRIEAGRTRAHFRPTDLAELTAELAASFTSATEQAGLTLSIDCAAPAAAVFVDRDMWEKIVLNLVSNAFKFTFEGGIHVALREVGGKARLEVRDTGTGIEPDQLPRLFERFHRVEGAKGRSFEGSGIGLALVQELAKLHGGEVKVSSIFGKGSTFAVEIPMGSAHLPADQVEHAPEAATMSGKARSFALDAMRWLPDPPAEPRAAPTAPGTRAERIVIADDNADLRAYIVRLLSDGGYEVISVADGEAALAEIRRRRPDLLISDVMMPKLDGFGLLRAVRADPVLGDLPIIMLSARAGEEATVEGLEAGSDDYLTKPFSARELLARVGANLNLARLRRESLVTISESEARFRNMAEHAPVMMWVSDVGGGITYVNRAWRAFTGQDDRPAWLEAIHPDDRVGVEGRLRDAAETRRAFDAEYRLRRADGAHRWASTAAAPRFDSDGGFLGYIGSVIDISERRDVESVLEERVAEAVAARAEIEEALRQAQKMESLGQLTGGIAHDFNNLLTVITGSVSITTRALDAAGVTDPRARRALDNAMKGAERAASLTHRLLAFSRRQPLAPKAIDVDTLLAGMSELLHRSLGETIELEIVAGLDLWRVEADPNQLESVILNLVVNARDAMPGGGRLVIETANTLLDESYAEVHGEVTPGQYVVLGVTDTGEGMTPETLARVFEPFFTTKEVGKGTGLGLSMVYGFTKQSGGHVKIYSEPGEGTAVKIYLPRLFGVVEPTEEKGQEIERPANQATILVVEDDDDVRAYSCEALRELGYHVLEANDGPAALRIIESRREPIALLFTDVVMPRMSGSELASRARSILPGLKVLYTSGYTRDAVAHGGRLDPGVEMISKPFTYQALGKKLSDMIEPAQRERGQAR
jgi:PAS domain S-box-containing protein